MPYSLAALLLVCLVAVHLWWRRRYAHCQAELAEKQKILQQQQAHQNEAVAEKQAQQEALFNSMAEGVLVLDRSGRIEIINQSLRRLCSLTADVRGQTILEAFRLQELARVVEQLRTEQVVR